MTKPVNTPYAKSRRAKGTSTWVNSRLQTQNRKLTSESNAASRSRGLIKARLTALTAKVALLESQVDELVEFLLPAKSVNETVSDRKAIQIRLLEMAELLDEEE